MILQVDVDSTLYDADPLFAKLSKEAGIDYPLNAYRWMSYNDIKKIDGTPVTLQEMKSVFRKAHSAEYVIKQKPYANAADVLNRITNKYEDIDVVFISDRHQQSNGPLRQWLVSNNFMHFKDDRVITTKDKRHWMRMNKPEIVIDDSCRTLLMARYELNATAIGIMHNHNMNLKNEADGIYIEQNWLDIEKILDKVISKYLGIK